MLQEVVCRILVVKAEPDPCVVVPGVVEGVEERVLGGVAAQVVQGVLPQGEPRPALGKDELDTTAAAGAGTSGVEK